MILKVVSEIHDPVTTTDELIPSGETIGAVTLSRVGIGNIRPSSQYLLAGRRLFSGGTVSRLHGKYGASHTQIRFIHIKFGPNIKDWPAMSALPEHMILKVVSEIHDPVTTRTQSGRSGAWSLPGWGSFLWNGGY